jgi:hypothetical protein
MCATLAKEKRSAGRRDLCTLGALGLQPVRSRLKPLFPGTAIAGIPHNQAGKPTDAKYVGTDFYKTFLACCAANARAQKLVDEICRVGDYPSPLRERAPRLTFEALRRYVENPSDLNEQTESRAKNHRSILRRAVRENGVAPAVGDWLHQRADQAFNTQRKGVARCTESLVWLEQFIKTKIGRRPTSTELALLIEATNEALGRKHTDILSESIRAELTRFKRKNEVWMNLLKCSLT